MTLERFIELIRVILIHFKFQLINNIGKEEEDLNVRNTLFKLFIDLNKELYELNLIECSKADNLFISINTIIEAEKNKGNLDLNTVLMYQEIMSQWKYIKDIYGDNNGKTSQ